MAIYRGILYIIALPERRKSLANGRSTSLGKFSPKIPPSTPLTCLLSLYIGPDDGLVLGQRGSGGWWKTGSVPGAKGSDTAEKHPSHGIGNTAKILVIPQNGGDGLVSGYGSDAGLRATIANSTCTKPLTDQYFFMGQSDSLIKVEKKAIVTSLRLYRLGRGSLGIKGK